MEKKITINVISVQFHFGNKPKFGCDVSIPVFVCLLYTHKQLLKGSQTNKIGFYGKKYIK